MSTIYTAYSGGLDTRRRPPRNLLGQTAFEIVMARRMAKGELETPGSSGTVEAHHRAPEPLAGRLPQVGRSGGIEIIETNKEIGLIEQAGIQAPLE